MLPQGGVLNLLSLALSRRERECARFFSRSEMKQPVAKSGSARLEPHLLGKGELARGKPQVSLSRLPKKTRIFLWSFLFLFRSPGYRSRLWVTEPNDMGRRCDEALAVLCLAWVSCLFSQPDEFLWSVRNNRQAEGNREEWGVMYVADSPRFPRHNVAEQRGG